jgi:DNA-binding CsgD family transcriptional regulator
MTDLQSEIMKCVAEGLTSKQIAYELGSTQKIVENNIVLMKSLFHAKNTAEMVSNFILSTLTEVLCMYGTDVAIKERKKVYKENPEIKKKKKATPIQPIEANKFFTLLGTK